MSDSKPDFSGMSPEKENECLAVWRRMKANLPGRLAEPGAFAVKVDSLSKNAGCDIYVMLDDLTLDQAKEVIKSMKDALSQNAT